MIQNKREKFNVYVHTLTSKMFVKSSTGLIKSIKILGPVARESKKKNKKINTFLKTFVINFY